MKIDLRPGSRILVRSLNEVGVILEYIEKRNELRVSVNRMTVTVGVDDVEPAPPEKIPEPMPNAMALHYKRKDDTAISIDLHGRRVEEAVALLEKFMDDALVAGLGFVRIVHGHGTGALRRGIHDYLKRSPIVKGYRHGAPNEGGGSVTIAELK
jgi:DNA mismatch repair protein MutS2